MENKCLMIKEETAFVNIVGFTKTTDLGNLECLGYLYIRVEVSGRTTQENCEEDPKYHDRCKH